MSLLFALSWFTMHYTVTCIHRLYVLGRFLFVCAVIRYASLCFTVLAVAKRKTNQGIELSLCLWATKFYQLMCAASRTQKIWTRCQNLNVFSYTSC